MVVINDLVGNVNPIQIIQNPLVQYAGYSLLVLLLICLLMFILWIFVFRPRLFDIEIEKHLIEGLRPIESTGKGRLWTGKDGVNRTLIFQGVFKKSKRLPEIPYNHFITKLLGNGKTVRKVRYLVSATDIWTSISPLEFDLEQIKKINIPKSDLSLWAIQEKKAVRNALLKETWWEANRSFVQYLIAWAFTLIIIYIVVKELGNTLVQAQSAQSACSQLQTQCEIAGSKLTGIIGKT